MAVAPLAFSRMPHSVIAAVFVLLQILLPAAVVAEKIVIHDIQVAQQQYQQKQLQQQQLHRSSSSSLSSPSTQLVSATIKVQLYRVSSTIKPYQRTLLANALQIFFEHVFDDSKQDVYKLDITHVAIYEEKLLMKATTEGKDRKLVLNSLQATRQFHMPQARSGGGAKEVVGDDDDDETEQGDDGYDDDSDDKNYSGGELLNSLQARQFHIQQARSGGGAMEVNGDDDETEQGDDGYDDEYYDDGSDDKNYDAVDEETESTEVVRTYTQTSDSGSDSSSRNFVLSFATFVSAVDSTQPLSSLSQEGEFEAMLIHICQKFSSHLVEFVQSIDDEYFYHVTNAMVSGYEDDELREKEEEEGMVTLESEMLTSSSESRSNAASIGAISLGSIALVLAAITVRRRLQRRKINRWKVHEISSSNEIDASSSIKSLQILYNKKTNDDYYDDDYSFDPLGTNNMYSNGDRSPNWSSPYDGDHTSNEKCSPTEEFISSSRSKLYQQTSSKINIALEEQQHVYAPPGKVGVAIDVIDGNPVVHKVKRGSPLEGLLQPKDIVIAIDDVDTTCMSAADVTQLMVKRMKFDRKITFVRRK